MAERAGCTVEANVEPDVPAVLGDERSVRSALENLVTNALKHAAGGRWIGVTARRAANPPGSVTAVDAGRREAMVEIAVSDRGPGVAPEDRPHIFEAFYRGETAVDRQVQGSGLGLSLVKRSVEGMGGRVNLEDAPGGGSRFVLLLPAADGTSPATQAGPA
jgi:signal transduction histidine kinase